ncbi:hypothetical protein MBRU_10825 [Mycolicibacterium brumae DSM 44177]|nr:hypothetical protein MBRU_10825 [Mycolicibacterium brumae DSM 44177]
MALAVALGIDIITDSRLSVTGSTLLYLAAMTPSSPPS